MKSANSDLFSARRSFKVYPRLTANRACLVRYLATSCPDRPLHSKNPCSRGWSWQTGHYRVQGLRVPEPPGIRLTRLLSPMRLEPFLSTTENTLTPFCPRKGPENTLTPFYPRRTPRRPFCPRRTAEGHGEHLNTFLSAEGRGGARRTP